MQRHGVNLVVDVGANVGQFGHAIRRSYDGEIVSFEPSSGPFADLKKAAAADPRWRAEQCALGEQAAMLDMQISPLSVLNSFLKPSEFGEATFGDRGKPSSVERVPLQRMDKTLPHSVPDLSKRQLFVKLDTQGFDLQAFAGMSGLLDRVVALQSEISLRPIYAGMPDWLQSLSVYQAAGFSVVGMFPAACDASGVPFEYDCLMTRSSPITQVTP
jgi:FkbM family methyltransferase